MESVSLRAPMGGIVVAVKKNAGDAVIEGQELAKIINSEKLLLVGVLDSRYYGKIKLGMEFTFTTDYLKEVFKARIEKIVPFSETGKEFKISAGVSNASLRLLTGTKATGIIELR